MATARCAMLMTLAALAAPAALVAQTGAVDEISLLRQAGQLEAAGELSEAEATLTRVVEARPTSAPALLALERVLRQQGRVVDLVGPAERAVSEEPGSALLNQLLLRTYSWLDREDAIEVAGEAWMKAVPELETAYREVARIWEERGDYQRARIALENGRDRVGSADALALELGTLYAALGETDLAAREWDRAIGPAPAGANQVRRQLRALPDGGAAIIPVLVDRLAAEGAAPARLGAAVDLAVAAGLEQVAIPLAERYLEVVEPDRQERFLLDLARRGDGGGLTRLAHWAYGQLIAKGHDDALPVLRTRYGELASEMGVTGVGGIRVAAADPEAADGAETRDAAAVRIELMAARDPPAALEALRAFRERYRDAQELDALAAAVAEALVAMDRVAEAEAALAGVRGPRSAVVSARLALARGDVQAARTAYMRAASDVRGAESTRLLSLAALLGRVSDEGARAIGRVMTAVAAGDPGAALDGMTADLHGLPADERPALMEFAATLADASDLDADARALRRRIVTEHPRTAEAPAALLGLARSIATETPEEARELLERLIIEYPRSALVPQARRELEQTGRRAADPQLNRSSNR